MNDYHGVSFVNFYVKNVLKNNLLHIPVTFMEVFL